MAPHSLILPVPSVIVREEPIARVLDYNRLFRLG